MAAMTVRILKGDCRAVLRGLPDESVYCVVTSPPYWGLRDYGGIGQIGLEASYTDYVAAIVDVFREVRRVLRKDGTLWLNLGDSYATGAGSGRSMGGKLFGKQNEIIDVGSYPENQPNRMPQSGLKPKDLVGIPWRVAFALQADGWWLRQDIIWSKPNPMPESVTDRCTKAHEYIFLLSKSERYYYDADAIKEDGSLQKAGNTQHKYVNGQQMNRTKSGFLEMRQNIYEKVNKRSVWEIATQPFSEAHFATFPPALIEPCILAGCPKGGTILDPFGGAGTTGLVADRLGRNAILIELNPEYAAMAEHRIENDAGLFADIQVGVAT
jgi:DNA modification methylase